MNDSTENVTDETDDGELDFLNPPTEADPLGLGVSPDDAPMPAGPKRTRLRNLRSTVFVFFSFWYLGFGFVAARGLLAALDALLAGHWPDGSEPVPVLVAFYRSLLLSPIVLATAVGLLCRRPWGWAIAVGHIAGETVLSVVILFAGIVRGDHEVALNGGFWLVVGLLLLVPLLSPTMQRSCRIDVPFHRNLLLLAGLFTTLVVVAAVLVEYLAGRLTLWFGGG